MLINDFEIVLKGTVDAAHFALTGYNEVIMLKPLSREDEKNALNIIHGTQYAGNCNTGVHDKIDVGIAFKWPTYEIVRKLQDLG
jgi:hypothetical protein